MKTLDEQNLENFDRGIFEIRLSVPKLKIRLITVRSIMIREGQITSKKAYEI